jgi:hypothetical protein
MLISGLFARFLPDVVFLTQLNDLILFFQGNKTILLPFKPLNHCKFNAIIQFLK